MLDTATRQAEPDIRHMLAALEKNSGEHTRFMAELARLRSRG